jgi:acetyl-CoA acetyltransferase
MKRPRGRSEQEVVIAVPEAYILDAVHSPMGAVHFAAQAVLAGSAELVVAGGVQTMCEGGGQADVTIIERL